jgi:hypothetical protein
MSTTYEIYKIMPSGVRFFVDKSDHLRGAAIAALHLCIEEHGNYTVFAGSTSEPILELKYF